MKKFIAHLICSFIPNKQLRRNLRNRLLHRNISVQSPVDGNEFVLIMPDGSKINNPTIRGLNVIWAGTNSKLILHAPIAFHNAVICLGDNNTVEIQSTHLLLHNFAIPDKMSDNSTLYIGKNFLCVGVKIFLHDEPYRKVVIGDDCMFSFDVVLWPSDGHTIYDNATGVVLNEPIDGITIGNHVWLCRGVSVLKNTAIADNSVVGLNSIVNKKFTETNVIIAGSPATIIKHGINWSHKNTYYFKQSNKEISK